MGERDRQALIDILAVLDRALGYPIPDHKTFVATDYLQDALIRRQIAELLQRETLT
jgi:uncharacterized protein with HEPN domain